MNDKTEMELKVPFKHARMWPRELFYRRLSQPKPVAGSKKPAKTQWLYKTIDLLTQPGVYVLYRNDEPYYIGQAEDLRTKLAAHARVPHSRYFNHWNYFSAFVVDKKELDNIEALLVAAMPTANTRKPLKKEPFPQEVTEMVNAVHLAKANPAVAEESEIDEEEL